MKAFILIFSILSFSLSISANDFICGDVKEIGPNFTLNVILENDELVYLINGEDTAYIDDSYSPRNPFYKTWKKIIGYFPSIGDGIDGFGVTLIVNKYLSTPELLKTAQFGMLDYRATGPEGYYSVRYRCDRVAE